jgi:hypothetical protein
MTTVPMTGFEPIGGAAVNASWEAVRADLTSVEGALH